MKGEEFITDLNFSKNEHLGRIEIDRIGRAALPRRPYQYENDKGEKFIVEIQKTKQRFFKDRSSTALSRRYYCSTVPVVEQAEQGALG